MKNSFLLHILLIILITQACNSSKSVLWVSGMKTECSAGAGKILCLQVHKGEDLEDPQWENFYAQIEGFEFEEGYLQKIKVKGQKLNFEEIPADASSIKYSLIKVLEKSPDYRPFLTDLWIMSSMNGDPINRKTPLPELSIDISEMTIFGTDGCNAYSGSIQGLMPDKIKFADIISTRRMCPDMTIANVYYKGLNSITRYAINDDKLIFYDESEKELFAFIKKEETAASERLHDIWIATRIEGNPINRMATIPRLEINLFTMRIMGTDGCNDYSGEIEKVTGSELLLGNIASTEKMCRNMDIPDRYSKALLKVHSYRLDNLNLMFYDDNGQEVLSFLKTD
ncbi:MAG: META domain-containing protein [Bacteroidia bacterium]